MMQFGGEGVIEKTREWVFGVITKNLERWQDCKKIGRDGVIGLKSRNGVINMNSMMA